MYYMYYNIYYIIFYNKYIEGDWGIGDWGLGQSPIPNPQSPNNSFNLLITI